MVATSNNKKGVSFWCARQAALSSVISVL